MSNQKRQAKTTNSKLRFLVLIRVSTERQERLGESLAVQKLKIQAAVKMLGGTIAGWYGGQEHATPGYEKKEINRLLSDAKKGKGNAFMCSHGDRWSRDNAKSREGLEIFGQYNIRFFILAQEYDLNDPDNVFCLDMFAVVGKFSSHRNKVASRDSKIKRAQDGKPSCGGKPHGRTYDKEKGWNTDPKKKSIIEDIAERLVKGDRLLDLANEYDFDKSGLHKILTKRSGDVWVQHFRKNGEVVEVPTKVPRLLDEEIIQAIKERLQANRTYSHGSITNLYLLSRMIFCEHCGYAMFGQTVGKYIYYRHPSTKHVKECNRPGSSKNIRADDIEDIVMRHLFEMFGNPAKVQAAIEAAIPNRQKLEQQRKRIAEIDIELEQLAQGINKVLRLTLKNRYTEAHAGKELDKAYNREKLLKDEQNRLSENRQNIPDVHQIKAMSKKVVKRFRRHNTKFMLEKKYANREYELMTYLEKKKLLELVFSGLTTDGHRMGVFIEWAENKGWKFNIRGHLISETGLLPLSDGMKDACFGDFSGAGHQQQKLLSRSAAC